MLNSRSRSQILVSVSAGAVRNLRKKGGGSRSEMSPSNYLQNGGGGGGNGRNWIEHEVSRFDTLAGVAIKYGVEVADIKKMNGLATDLQMFALKTLRIPLPGRHPPSHSPPNGATRYNSPERRPQHIGQSSMLEPYQSLRLKPPRQKTSSAMTSLQAFYGLKSSNPRGTSEGTELAVYRSHSSDELRDYWLPEASPASDLPSDQNLKSRNFNYDLLTGDGAVPQNVPVAESGDGGGEKSDEKSVRRRQKAEVDIGVGTPARLLKEENSGGSGGFSSSTGKGLGTKPKSATRLFPEIESGWLDSIPAVLGESIITDVLSGVRKSLSTSSLKEQEKSNSSTIWPAGKWSLKPPDLQALSTAAIVNPILNGFPIAITSRRNKAARD